MDTVKLRISERALKRGVRLPSIRALARSLQVSTSTVIEAYDRLSAEGVVIARPGSGYFVAEYKSDQSELPARTATKHNIDVAWMTRQSLEMAPQVLGPGCGWLPEAWMPKVVIEKALRATARDQNTNLTRYSEPAGHSKLRGQVQRRLNDRGIDTSIGQIALVGSSTQAIDIVCRSILSPGDTVIVDDPCYFNIHKILAANRAKVISVPYTPSGPDLSLFSHAVTISRPKLYITNSTTHNPTGACVTTPVARDILRIAEQANLLIVEDDVFADFEQRPVTRLAVLDGLRRVIYLGSFSKTLAAGARCGYIAASPQLVEMFIDLHAGTTFGCQTIATEVVYRMLVGGGYRRHIDSLICKLSEATSVTIRRLQGLGIRPWLDSYQGMYVWAQLPDGLDAGEIARSALSSQVMFAPGNAFSLSGSYSSFMRFNVAHCLDLRVFEVLNHAIARNRRSLLDE